MTIKKVFVVILLAMTLICCQQKKSHPLTSISDITMNRILIFTESRDEILRCYTFYDDENIYCLNSDANIEDLESIIYKPYALSYLFSVQGSGQKIGLTDCQDPYVTIMSDKNILNKALNAFTEEEIEDAYQKAIEQENR